MDAENQKQAMTKRSASSLPSSAAPHKKHAVLSEITNLSNLNAPARFTKKNVAAKAVCSVEGNSDQLDDDPQMCAPYASDIYRFLRSSEVKRRPNPKYMESIQNDIVADMRSVLVDWLVEVAEEYRLLSETLFLAVSYVDRFLSFNALHRQKLQLLGVSCMLIASKHEEIRSPHVEDFCYITDNTYRKEEVVEMERKILAFLNFEMSNPTVKNFLRRCSIAAEGKSKLRNKRLDNLCNYLAELSLLEYDCLGFLPSQIAASVLFLAKFTMDPKSHPWNLILQDQTGYKVSELKDCIHVIHELQLNIKNYTLVATREKYKHPKVNSVSTLVSPIEIPGAFFEDLNDGCLVLAIQFRGTKTFP